MHSTIRLPVATSRVLISILNWNASAETIACVESVRAAACESGASPHAILVIDNASRPDEWEALAPLTAADDTTVWRSASNLGFAAGHNLAIRAAQAAGHEFVWLLNNDARVAPNACDSLLALLDGDPRCGAASPLIVSRDDVGRYDFCGATHDWRRLETPRPTTPAAARALEAADPFCMWLAGTAVMLRLRALTQVGLLDDTLFAYFEDDDLGVRLSRAGWTSRLAFDTLAVHAGGRDQFVMRPPYYFYLMTRNGLRFWLAHTPAPYRLLIRYRLAARAFILADRLTRAGHADKATAVLLGVQDGLLRRAGAPDLARRPSWSVRCGAKFFSYRLYSFVNEWLAAW